MRSSLVITSISEPNAVLRLCADGSCRHQVDFILVGDTKSPPDFFLPGCDYWDIQKQVELPFLLANCLPEKHYSRKNIGYLIAMKRGADIIFETDDDNFPLESFWRERESIKTGPTITNSGWINVYSYFTKSLVWPRGFPLEYIKHSVPHLDTFEVCAVNCPIQQGLVNENPDVDAVYRLTAPLPINFDSDHSVIAGKNTWVPFNSQNTSWFKEAFLLLYIPSFCSFRMCDIWRSFVAQRICWANDWGIYFHGPTMWQQRNEHSLIGDFEAEIPGYLNNARLCSALGQLSLAPGINAIPENMRKCYQAFVDLGLVASAEINLLDAWLHDVDLLVN